MDITKISEFNDLVEGQRRLEITARIGMIHFQLSGGRLVMMDTFRLDSEEVSAFVTALYAAKSRIHGKPEPEAFVTINERLENECARQRAQLTAQADALKHWRREVDEMSAKIARLEGRTFE